MTVYNFYNPIYHNKHIRGTLTSLTDFSVINHVRIHNCTTDLMNMILLSQKNKYFGLENYNFSDCDCTDDVIITSSRIMLDSVKESKIKLTCKTLVLLDSADIYFGNVGVYPNVGLILQNNPNIKFDKLILLGNPANKELLYHKYEFVEYYHKFNIERLKKLNLKSIKYSRDQKEWIRVYNSYFENIGKGLIERLIMNVPVQYLPDGKDFNDGLNDGLHYYLKYLGIDDNIGQELKNIDTFKLVTNDLSLLKDMCV